MRSVYHGVVVVSVLSDNSYTERLKGKLNGSEGDYLIDSRAEEGICSFFEEHKLSMSSDSADADQEPFLLLGAIHKEGNDKVEEVVIARCYIYETVEEEKKKYWIHSEDVRFLSGDRFKLIIDDLAALFNLKLKGNLEDHGYLQIEPSKKAIEKVFFYLNPKKSDRLDPEMMKQTSNEGASHIEDSPYCQRDENAYRLFPERNGLGEGCRTQYQIDYERIVSTKAFRRLVDKAQVFSSSKGDHYRTRMTHTLTVNQIARALSQAFGLNVMLTEAIAFAHDIGHTPFGHQGERTLDDILKGRTLTHLKLYGSPEHERNGSEPCDLYGGFKHNFQSVRTLCTLEEDHIFHRGINAVSTKLN